LRMTNAHIDQPVRYSGAPIGAANPVVIAVHGRGQEPDYVEAIVERLRWAEATCIAPRAAGGSWYPQRFIAPTAPVERVRESAALFSRLGAEVFERVYRGMGHTVSDAEVEDVRRALGIA
jgi:phospholipase/carboxylesterase